MTPDLLQSVDVSRARTLLLLTILLPLPVFSAVERVSLDSSAAQGDDESQYPAISDDGRYIAFASYAGNLVPGFAGWQGIFLRDTTTGQTEHISVNALGDAADDESAWPAVSADGQYVAFASYASNLVSDDFNRRWDVFLRDRVNRETTLVSISSSGVQGNGTSENPDLSADGRFIAFQSYSSNLIPLDGNYSVDIFLRDAQSASTRRVSVPNAGGESNGNSFDPAISADGRIVAYWSVADNLVDGDSNNAWDVFLRDIRNGTTERISVSSSGKQGNADSLGTSMSADGGFVAFESDATNLVPGDTNGARDVFVRDRKNGTTERISVASGGVQANANSYDPSISDDGRFVAFLSSATNLDAGDSNGTWDIFLHDRSSGTTRRISVDDVGTESNGYSWSPAISATGSAVAFASDASNLVSGDTNGFTDVFRWSADGGSADIAPLLAVVPGISGRPAFAVVTDDIGNGVPGILVKRASGAVISAIGLPAGKVPVALRVVDDFAGTAAPELAVLFADGGATVYDVLSGETLGRPVFSSFATLTDLEVAHDRDGSGVPDLAVLGQPGRKIEIRDAETGNPTGTLGYLANLRGVDLVALSGSGGISITEFAVLGEATYSGLPHKLRIIDSDTGNLLQDIALGNVMTPRQSRAIEDVNRDGAGDLATLRTGPGRVSIVIHDPATGRQLSNIWFAPAFEAVAMVAIPDVTGNGKPEVGVLGRRSTDGTQRIELKDSGSKNLVKRIWLPKQFVVLAAEAVPDMNRNGSAEIAVLGRRADGQLSLFIKDGKTGAHVARMDYN